ncbi:hypothetical protein [Spongorhabdus nitratireducens]
MRQRLILPLIFFLLANHSYADIIDSPVGEVNLPWFSFSDDADENVSVKVLVYEDDVRVYSENDLTISLICYEGKLKQGPPVYSELLSCEQQEGVCFHNISKKSLDDNPSLQKTGFCEGTLFIGSDAGTEEIVIEGDIYSAPLSDGKSNFPINGYLDNPRIKIDLEPDE